MKFHFLCPHCDSDDLTKRGGGRHYCKNCEKNFSNPKIGGDFPEKKIEKKVIVLTAAQNATPVSGGFWKALQKYVTFRKAQLLVIPLRYRNPTSQWTSKNQSHEWWAPEVIPYLLAHELEVNDNLVIHGHVKTQPTAANPLQGLENLSGHRSALMGHAQIQQASVPVNPDRHPKMVSTTGVCTKKNYSDTKAGIKGAFHHELAAVVIEIEDEKIAHVRHLISDGTSSFYDLDIRATSMGITKTKSTAGFVSGDLHGIHHSPSNAKAVWLDRKSLVKRIKPRKQAFHDVLDMHWGSHHHLKDPFLKVQKYYNGKNLASTEIEETLALLQKLSICNKNYVIASNHNEHFGKWLKEHDWKTDPANAEVYLETSLQYVLAAKEDKQFDPLEYWADRLSLPKNIEFLTRDDSLEIRDIECTYHGDRGPGGARGSRVGFNKIGTKTIIAHGHGPGREKGCCQLGTSSQMNLGYNEGTPSSWMHTHGIIHNNGKVQLVTVSEGSYCAHW